MFTAVMASVASSNSFFALFYNRICTGPREPGESITAVPAGADYSL